MMRAASVLAFLLIQPATLATQTVGNPADALLDLLVWGTHVKINPEAYDAALKLEIQQYLRRALAYRSDGPLSLGGESAMTDDARIRYERRLVAVSDDPTSPEMAAAYVKSLQPCYEWEGFHDCPEREAQFADEYQAAHPSGPFSAYLPLLAAHRWLCTAEAYEYEQRPVDAERSRRAYQARLELARQRKDLLVRAAAERLGARARCFASR